MARRIAVVVAVLVLFALAGLLIPYVMKLRARAEDVACRNNLREIGLFTAHHAHPRPDAPPGRFLTAVPAGTVVLPGVPPDERLSWVASALSGLDQRRQNTESLLAAIDRGSPWPAGRNQQAARTRLVAFVCPGNVPESAADRPALTSYVGVGGLGADAPATADPARAGCFRYDGPTPFDKISNGLSQTLMSGERSADLGPWLRGGPSTVRGLDVAAGAAPLLGPGGQFGGNHPTVSNWGMADGAVRTFTPRVDPKVLHAMATIAGGDKDPLPGE